jgi:hypothetical protein
MLLRGIIQTAVLEENPPQSERIEMVLKVQGVGPTQPRTLVIPFELLVADETLEPESLAGRGFEAEVDQADDRRWIVARIALASRVLRSTE